MVLTDRQRSELHAGIYEYLIAQDSESYLQAAEALARADPSVKTSRTSLAGSDDCSVTGSVASSLSTSSPILERKWVAVPRLQKKVIDLERQLASVSKSYTSHRLGGDAYDRNGSVTERRLLPRPPCAHTLKGHSGVVNCVALHPIFTLMVSGSEDGTIKIWDHESGEYLKTLKGHTSTIHSLAFTPTGSHLASSSSDLSIKIWDFTSTHTCIRTLRGHDHTISAVRFIPSLHTDTISSSNISLKIVEVNNAQSGIDVSTAGSSFLVSSSRDCTVKLWALENWFCQHTISDHNDWVRCIAVRDSDGGLLATAGNDQVIFVYSITATTATSCEQKKIAELRGHEHVIETISFICSLTPTRAGDTAANKVSSKKLLTDSNNDALRNYLVSGGRDRSVRLWNVCTAECISVFNHHENWVRAVLLHPSGNYIISAGDDRSIRIADVKANRCIKTIDDAHPHFVTSLDIHPVFPILVSGGVDQSVRCWRLD